MVQTHVHHAGQLGYDLLYQGIAGIALFPEKVQQFPQIHIFQLCDIFAPESGMGSL